MNCFSIKRPIFIVSSNKCIEEYAKIDKFIEILNKSGIGKLIENAQKNIGRRGYNPFNLVAAIIYCFSQFKSTIREIENLCTYDLRVMYITEQHQPSDTSIKDCINEYILPYQYEIFSMVTKAIVDEFNLDISNQYIGGTKIEANANKYKFVWKPVKFQKRLNEKIKELITEMNLEYNDNKTIKSSTFKEVINRF